MFEAKLFVAIVSQVALLLTAGSPDRHQAGTESDALHEIAACFGLDVDDHEWSATHPLERIQDLDRVRADDPSYRCILELLLQDELEGSRFNPETDGDAQPDVHRRARY